MPGPDDFRGAQPVEPRPTPLPYPVGSPGEIGPFAAPAQPPNEGLRYLAEQVKSYQEMGIEQFVPPELQWVNQWSPGEQFAHRGAPEGIRFQSRQEEERIWESGWMRVTATPQGYQWLPSAPPHTARGQAPSGQNYYIPWVLPDPMEAYPDAAQPALTWYDRKEMPYDPQTRIIGKGREEFVPTKRILKKITWYVPDGVEVGLPRLPVKVFGRPPEEAPPQQTRTTTDMSHAVDFTGLRADPRYNQWLEGERAKILADYKHQAKLTRKQGQDCAEALI